MSLNYKELDIFWESYNNRIVNSTVKKLTKVCKDELFIQLKKDKEIINLIVKITSKYCFIGEGKPIISPPKQPYNFTSVLRKYLSGKKIIDFIKIEKERILTFKFDEVSLVLELTGRNGNIFLINNESKIILGLLFIRDGEKRKELINEKYIPINVLNSTKNADANKGIKDFKVRESIIYLLDTPGKSIYVYFYTKIYIDIIDKILKNLNKDLIKTDKLIKKIEKESKINMEYKEFIDKGNLILSNLYKFSGHKKYNEIEVDSLDNNMKLLIKLDPKITLIENANKFFEKAKKMKKRLKEIEKRKIEYLNNIDLIKEKIEIYKNIKETFEENLKTSPELNIPLFYENKDLLEDLYRNISKTNKKENELFYKFYLSSGKEIIIGKSSEANLKLLRLSRGEHYWFHVRDFPGSYVIVKSNTLTKEDIIEAANFALLFSKARNTGKADIIYTKCKYLKPVKSSKGKVIYTNDKNIYIELDYKLTKKIMNNNIKER